MEGLFLPNGEPTKLMPGDEIIFTQIGDNPETVAFFRGKARLSLMGAESEYSCRLTQVERTKLAKRVAADAGMELRISELGQRKTVFLVHSI